jgi:hypothetical protein
MLFIGAGAFVLNLLGASAMIFDDQSPRWNL